LHFSGRTAQHYRSTTLKQGRLLATFGVLLVSAGIASSAFAQNQDIIRKGDAVVTGFSGMVQWPNPKGTKKVDYQVINLQGVSLQVFELAQMFGADEAKLVKAPRNTSISAAKIGQVFGVTLDDGVDAKGEQRAPNIYATATSAFGLQLVRVTKQQIDRSKSGGPNAKWMQGMFGTRLGGGPGSIWKIDGSTGAVSLFANVKYDGQDNTGPALGNIAFDARSRRLFVSDLQTGMIHALDLKGDEIDLYDHGAQGRAAQGLNPSAFDPAVRVSITSSKFKSDDPSTWGFASLDRRVWGVAVYDKRLYYSVARGPEIWSIGVTADGTFAKDPRLEIEVKAKSDDPISDIAFDDNGSLFLSQRGQTISSYDFSVLAKSNTASVLRYTRKRLPDGSVVWDKSPAEYAIGFADSNKNTNGGIALGYGYYPDGAIRYDACKQMLWSTGEQLRRNLKHASRLGTPEIVNGLQAMQKTLVKPANAPPFQTYYIDFDNVFNDARSRGHIGDVEIWSACPSSKTAASYPTGWKPRVPGQPYVRIRKSCSAAALGGKMLCRVTLTNFGGGAPADRVGFEDIAKTVFGPAGANGPLTLLSADGDDSRWDCSYLPATTLECWLPGSALTPGKQRSVDVVVDVSPISGKSGWRIKNSATLSSTGETATVFASNDVEVTKSGPATCRAGSVCTFQITINNYGVQTFYSDLSFVDDLTISGAPASGVTVAGVYPSQGCALASSGVLPANWTCEVAVPANDFKTFYVDMMIPVSAGPAAGTVPARNCALAAPPGLALVGGQLPGNVLGAALAATNISSNSPGTACHDFDVSAPNTVSPGPQGPQVNPPSLPQWPQPWSCNGQPTFTVTSVSPSSFSTAGVPVTFEYTIENTTNCEIKAFRIDESLPMFQAAICGSPTVQVVPPGAPTWGDWWGTLRPNQVANCSSLYVTPNVKHDIVNNVRVDSKW
jgi:hypothetical protein